LFGVWGWEDWKTVSPSVEMDVIVGRARGTPTPVSIVGELRELVFRPFWNVPRSIVMKEVLPLAMRDPTYLARENMEIVRGDGDDADVVETSAANLARLRAGTLRVRQRPGPRNALGLAKFVFPNVQNVYLHDTPGRSLFTRARRDFSHGCVRVEDPVGLAVWVLNGDGGWGREQVLAAMHGTNNRHVPVLKAPTVVVFYATAFVMPKDGLLHFADDIYGQDVLLDRKLTSLSGR
jgi:murein L,D-transpeptidase YcbB/YkuD